MTKRISLLMAGCMLCLCLWGCGESGGESRPGESAPPAPGREAAVEEIDGDESREDFSHLVGTRGNTTSNTINGGGVARDGDWIYYTTPGEGVYKVRTDGTEHQRITGDSTAQSLNAVDGWLYYSTAEAVVRVRDDGEDRQQLFYHEEAWNSYVSVVDGWIYFTTTYGRYIREDDPFQMIRMRVDGSGQEVLLDGEICVSLNVVDGWIYFLILPPKDMEGDGFQVCRMRTDGGEVEPLPSLTALYQKQPGGPFLVEDGAVYWQTRSVVSVPLEGGAQVDYPNSPHAFNVSGGWVYQTFTKSSSSLDDGVYRTPAGGGERELVLDLTGIEKTSVTDLYVCDDLMFFMIPDSPGNYTMYVANIDGSGLRRVDEAA